MSEKQIVEDARSEILSALKISLEVAQHSKLSVIERRLQVRVHNTFKEIG